MFKEKKMIRIFWVSFFITLITTVFLLCLFWVNFRAKDTGFEGFDMSVKLERLDDLHYNITAGGFSEQLDLTTADRAAGFLQTAERWMFPRGVRTLSRIGYFAAEQIKDGNREAREREFYKNAGLV